MSKPKGKAKIRRQSNDLPAIYYSDTPVGLEDWRAGRNSPKPKPVDADRQSLAELSGKEPPKGKTE